MDEKIKQTIEEMAKIIKPIVVSSYLVDRGNDEVKQNAINEVKKQQTRNATALYNAGYRKESDTAREIFEKLLGYIGSQQQFCIVDEEHKTLSDCDKLFDFVGNLAKEKYGVDLGE